MLSEPSGRDTSQARRKIAALLHGQSPRRVNYTDVASAESTGGLLRPWWCAAGRSVDGVAARRGWSMNGAVRFFGQDDKACPHIS